MSRQRSILFLLIALPLIACGSSSSSSSSSSGGTDTSTSGFQVSGTLSALAVTTSTNANLKTATTGTITDIMAVSPTTGSVTCKKIEVEDDGSFSFRIGSKKPWFFYFFDRSKSGKNMFMGRYKSSDLDTLLPTSDTGSTSLGTVTVDGDAGTATSTKTQDDLVSDLGLSSTTVETLSNIDDVARRYSNPDMDSDGTADCDQTNRNFNLDFHIRFNMLVNNTQTTLTDIIDSFWSASTLTPSYQSTGIYISYSSDFSSVDTGSVTFVNSAVTTSEGGSITANTATSDVTTNNFGNFKGFGPNLTSSSELPTGEIVYSFDSKEITFSDVQTPTLATLTAPTNRPFLFLKLNKSDTSCTSNCTFASLAYEWKIKTATGFNDATLEEIETLVDDDGGTLSFRVDNDASKTASISIPNTAISGTITWSGSNASLSGITSSEFEALVTTQLCNIGLSYDDKLGMRYFENINNADGTCS